MRKTLLIAAAGFAALALFSGGAGAQGAAAPSWAGTCGLPRQTPLWVDYGWPDLASIFGRRGIIVTGAGGDYPAQMRTAGADTVFFDLSLKNRVGQPLTPADPSTIKDRADKLFAFASQQMGCSTPTMVENELFGAGLVTPWSDTNVQYRANVLAYLQELAAKGAHPVLLINSNPYTAGDAGTWWQQVGAVADIVREAYLPAPALWKAGPLLANRTLRTAYRRYIGQLTSIGIPPQKLGIMVSFSTTKGAGGRNGLQPRSAWFEVAKWQALAARTVAKETGIGSIWAWGWAEWTAAEQDPDKATAACVWLWTRSPSLCDAPSAAGPGFDTSLTEGQIRLPAGVQCTTGKSRLSSAAIGQLARLTGDRDTAYTALWQRLVENAADPVSPKTVLAAERAVIADRFGGSRGAYLSALAQAHAGVAVARGILGDELRRAGVEAGLSAQTPSGADVTTFYRSYPDVLVRSVKTKQPTPWLDNRTSGMILSAVAPEELFTGGARRIWTPSGFVSVTPRGDAVPLGSVPLSQARGGIVAALKQFSRGEAYERWSEAMQKRALNTATCARDDLPQVGAIELSSYVPFLRLS
jgi:hypothetical protein